MINNEEILVEPPHLVDSQPIVILNQFKLADVQALHHYALDQENRVGRIIQLHKFVADPVKRVLEVALKAEGASSESISDFYASHEEFFSTSYRLLSGSTKVGDPQSAVEAIRRHKIKSYRGDEAYFFTLAQDLEEIYPLRIKRANETPGSALMGNEISAVKEKILGAPYYDPKGYARAMYVLNQVAINLGVKDPKNFGEWFQQLYKVLKLENANRIREQELERIERQNRAAKTIPNSEAYKKRSRDSDAQSAGVEPTAKATVALCSVCGSTHSTARKCLLFDHPDANHTQSTWANSPKGKEWAARQRSYLPWYDTLDGKGWEAPSKQRSKVPRATGSGELDRNCPDCLLTLNEAAFADTILVKAENPKLNVQRNLRMLLDGGAISANYISADAARTLQLGSNLITCQVCTGFNGLCGRSYGTTSLLLTVFDETTRALSEPIAIEARIIDTPFELIIGKYTDIEHNLRQRLKVQYERSRDLNAPDLAEFKSSIDGALSLDQGSVHALKVVTPTGIPNSVDSLATLKDKNEFFKVDTELLDEDSSPELPEFIYKADPSQTNEPTIPTEIFGPDRLRQAIRKLVIEYVDIFSTVVCPEPATIEPMSLLVDTSIWHQYKNRGAPRPQTAKAQREIKNIIDQLLLNKVIKKSQAVYYSQVLLVPKPNGSWRMCIDYKKLNDATVANGWPLPNIEQMLHRIGDQRPRFFAVMDMISGYHQVAMHHTSTVFTAFICFMGVFEWLRIPFGLKGAPGYFQQQMAAVVLAGLVHIICELYLDDCIVFGRSEEEFIDRLRQVFSRFRQYNIKLNPLKCKFGLSNVEYVGYLIDSTGLTFSRKRIEDCINMKKPEKESELKMFVGLANFFHKFIRNLSMKLAPLHQLLTGYKKNSKKLIQWSSQADAAYDQIMEDIRSCPRLFFLNPHDPVFLHTDASDFGIGGYLFQKVEGEDHPIAFISKALSGAQKNWSTYDKEAFAIFYSISKLQHLIRDIKFTVRTDHKNLTYIGEGGTQKVARWREFLLPFNFDVEHIPGVDNVAADGFSRLCSFLEIEDDSMEAVDFLQLYQSPADLVSVLTQFGELDCLMSLTDAQFNDQNFRIPSREFNWIQDVHNAKAGHFGSRVTYDRLLKAGHKSRHLFDYVRLFIKRCPHCQKTSAIQPTTVIEPFVTSTADPMFRLNIDSIGPLEESSHGFKHIMVIIDCFSRYVTLWPLRTLEAQEAAIALIQHIGMFGTPKEILTDGGSQFKNKLITELMDILKIDHQITIAYSKQENGAVERANKEVLRHLRAFVEDVTVVSSWPVYLPLVQRIINAKVHESLQVSPASIITPGIDLDNAIIPSKISDGINMTSMEQYIVELREIQKLAIDTARKHLLDHEKDHIQPVSLPLTVFPIGSHVLLSYPTNVMGQKKPPHKLLPQWQGPFEVTNCIGNEYFLRNLVSGKQFGNVHVSRLKQYHSVEGQGSTPRAVANLSQEAYDIESISKHKGSFNKPSTLQFRVKWVGYDNLTWEPWKNVKANRIVHLYLLSIGKGNHIPLEFQHLYDRSRQV